MPRHTVPWYVAGQVTEKELYDLTPANGYDYFQQWLYELDQGKSDTLIYIISNISSQVTLLVIRP